MGSPWRSGSRPARRLPAVALIMLTSSGQPGDLGRCRELGIAAHLLKPVPQGELLEAVVRALHLSPAPARRASTAGGRRSNEKWSSLRILLAEDNRVNQRLAVGLLEKRGHAVVVAADGKQALAALEREPFDLMFMDVQMPEMGGFEATARIRDQEQKTGKHLPIIAMTAHAMKGDRERCLASGMDGYVSKPILAAELFRAIDEAMTTWGPRPPAAANGLAAPVFDQAASLERAGGDEQLLGGNGGPVRGGMSEADAGDLGGHRPAGCRGPGACGPCPSWVGEQLLRPRGGGGVGGAGNDGTGRGPGRRTRRLRSAGDGLARDAAGAGTPHERRQLGRAVSLERSEKRGQAPLCGRTLWAVPATVPDPFFRTL